jgi:asparagine synthase (glutamine-hydrolysing)
MSGIVGIVRRQGELVDQRTIEHLTDLLVFRGPDARRTHAAENAGFGHTLLQTDDDGPFDRQPLVVESDVLVVADARIDDREALVGALERAGVPAAIASTDAELIGRAYLAWGADCPSHLLGDFAFAVWDTRRQQLLCARDQVGIKPFFYSADGAGIAFSNTLQCLRRVPGLSDALNDRALADFLLFGHNPEHDTTAFAAIRRLPPAHALVWAAGATTVRRYYTLPIDEPDYRDEHEWRDGFEALLQRAVADRVRSRRCTVSLSGGLDSTLVAVAARDVLGASGRPFDLRASTVVFRHAIADPEGSYAAQTAAALRLPIDCHAADDYPLLPSGDHRVYRSGEPTMLAGLVGSSARFEQVSAHSRVMLTGQGGDVLLRPSASYAFDALRRLRVGPLLRHTARHLRRVGRMPRIGARTRIRHWLRSPVRPATRFPDWIAPSLITELALRERFAEVMNRQRALVRHHRPEAYAVATAMDWGRRFESYDAGRTGVALSIRHPLFDLRLVRFALTIPTMPWCLEKGLMRETLRGRVPDAVRLRAKSPLGANPADSAMDRGDVSWLSAMPASPLLKRFVRESAARPHAGTARLSDLRPLFLNVWLQSLHRDTVVPDIDQEEEHLDALTARSS